MFQLANVYPVAVTAAGRFMLAPNFNSNSSGIADVVTTLEFAFSKLKVYSFLYTFMVTVVSTPGIVNSKV